MNLVVYDLDGTLTKSNKADRACFEAVLKKTFGLAEVAINPAEYEQATASFIFRHFFHQQHQRNPRPEEVEEAQRLNLAYLKQVLTAKPSCVSAVPGAARLLKYLQGHPLWRPAIVSGGWRAAGLRKLVHAGLDARAVPMAFAEDGLSLEGIIGHARERAIAAAKIVSFDRIVLVGDGVWDLKAARALRYPFIGITCDADAAALKRAGARVLLADFSAPPAFLAALEREETLTSTGTGRAARSPDPLV